MLPCKVQPGFNSIWLSRRQRYRHGKSGHNNAGPPGQAVECQPVNHEVVGGRQFLGHGEVVTCPGILLIGNHGGARRETAHRQIKLAGDCKLAGPRGLQDVLRRQHVEVGLRHLDYEGLLCGLEVGLRDRQIQLRSGDVA